MSFLNSETDESYFVLGKLTFRRLKKKKSKSFNFLVLLIIRAINKIIELKCTEKYRNCKSQRESVTKIRGPLLNVFEPFENCHIDRQTKIFFYQFWLSIMNIILSSVQRMLTQTVSKCQNV